MTAAGLALAPHWWWLVGAVVLAIAELIAPGFFLIWLAAAALLTGAATALFGLGLGSQVALFATVAVATVFAVRRWLAANPIVSADPLLNDRVARLIGEIVTVEEAVEPGCGRVRVGDGVWNARGPAAAAGTRVRVVGAEGSCLLVDPV